MDPHMRIKSTANGTSKQKRKKKERIFKLKYLF